MITVILIMILLLLLLVMSPLILMVIWGVLHVLGMLLLCIMALTISMIFVFIGEFIFVWVPQLINVIRRAIKI